MLIDDETISKLLVCKFVCLQHDSRITAWIVFREHQNCKKFDPNLDIIGSISLTLENFSVTIEINEIIYLMPCTKTLKWQHSVSL